MPTPVSLRKTATGIACLLALGAQAQQQRYVVTDLPNGLQVRALNSFGQGIAGPAYHPDDNPTTSLVDLQKRQSDFRPVTLSGCSFVRVEAVSVNDHGNFGGGIRCAESVYNFASLIAGSAAMRVVSQDDSSPLLGRFTRLGPHLDWITDVPGGDVQSQSYGEGQRVIGRLPAAVPPPWPNTLRWSWSDHAGSPTARWVSGYAYKDDRSDDVPGTFSVIRWNAMASASPPEELGRLGENLRPVAINSRGTVLVQSNAARPLEWAANGEVRFVGPDAADVKVAGFTDGDTRIGTVGKLGADRIWVQDSSDRVTFLPRLTNGSESMVVAPSGQFIDGIYAYTPAPATYLAQRLPEQTTFHGASALAANGTVLLQQGFNDDAGTRFQVVTLARGAQNTQPVEMLASLGGAAQPVALMDDGRIVVNVGANARLYSADGSWLNLGTPLSPTTSANAARVDAFGAYVVGGSTNVRANGRSTDRPVVWNNSTNGEVLNSLGPDNNGRVLAVNARGDAVGRFVDSAFVQAPIAWNSDNGLYTMIDLGLRELDDGSLIRRRGEATGINDTRRVVGWMEDDQGRERAFIWIGWAPSRSFGDSRTELGPLSFIDLGDLGGPRSAARAINAQNVVVGWAETAEPGPFFGNRRHGFLWKNGLIFDLNTLRPSAANVRITDAQAINDAGQIVALADAWNFDPYAERNDSNWSGRVVVLNVSPEDGLTQETAIMPLLTMGNRKWFGDTASGSWVDPATAGGLRYTMDTAGSSFASLVLPVGVDADGFFEVYGADFSLLGRYAEGTRVELGGVGSFYLGGLTLGAGQSTLDVPVQLFFTTASAAFTIDAVAAVPEPGAWALMLLGTAGLAVWTRRRRA